MTNKPYIIPKRLINLQSTITTCELQYEILRALETVSEQLFLLLYPDEVSKNTGLDAKGSVINAKGSVIVNCDCALGMAREEKRWYCPAHGRKDFSVETVGYYD